MASKSLRPPVRTVATANKNSTRVRNMPTVSHSGGVLSLYYTNLFKCQFRRPDGIGPCRFSCLQGATAEEPSTASFRPLLCARAVRATGRTRIEHKVPYPERKVVFVQKRHPGVFVGVATVLVVMLVPGCGSSGSTPGTASGSKSPIKIALITSETGIAAAEFQTSPQGFLARIDLQNADGGVNGHKTVPIVINDQGSLTTVATAVQQAISEGV